MAIKMHMCACQHELDARAGNSCRDQAYNTLNRVKKTILLKLLKVILGYSQCILIDPDVHFIYEHLKPSIAMLAH